MSNLTRKNAPSVPSGTMTEFGGGLLPNGWLWCDGATISRTLFAPLFGALGTTWGEGDGATTFHLPDMRGRFLRGADDMGTGAAGRDPDAASRTASNAGGAIGGGVGSVQSDQSKSHRHVGGLTAPSSGTRYGITNTGINSTYLDSGGGSTTPYGVNSSYDGGNETRPQNAAVNYIIKI